MKKYISTIVALCAIFATTTASAQEWIFGAKVGLNMASVSHHGDDTEGRELYRSPRFGLSAGLTGEYKFNDDISLSTEVLFSQQGVKYTFDTVYGDYNDKTEEYDSYENCKETYRFSYINIPILFNYYLAKSINLSFNVGIQPGFLISENTSTKYSDSEGNSETWDGAWNWDGGYYLFDLAVPFGFTYGVLDHMTIDLRYTLGVLNTFDAPNSYKYTKNFKSTNNSLTLSVGYRF